MNLSISGASASIHSRHDRVGNFGALNSALARGDLGAAQTAFTAINDSMRHPALAAKSKGSLEAIGTAIASGDLTEARKALADFRTGRGGKTEGQVASPSTATGTGTTSAATGSEASAESAGLAPSPRPTVDLLV